jgi:hypothetical protein
MIIPALPEFDNKICSQVYLGARKKFDCIGNRIFQPGFPLQFLARYVLYKRSLRKACFFCRSFALRDFSVRGSAH